MTTFDQRGQHVETQYSTGWDIYRFVHWLVRSIWREESLRTLVNSLSANSVQSAGSAVQWTGLFRENSGNSLPSFSQRITRINTN